MPIAAATLHGCRCKSVAAAGAGQYIDHAGFRFQRLGQLIFQPLNAIRQPTESASGGFLATPRHQKPQQPIMPVDHRVPIARSVDGMHASTPDHQLLRPGRSGHRRSSFGAPAASSGMAFPARVKLPCLAVMPRRSAAAAIPAGGQRMVTAAQRELPADRSERQHRPAGRASICGSTAALRNIAARNRGR